MSDAGDHGVSGIARQPPTAFPGDYRPIPFEGYETLNLKSPRQAIKDTELAWCDGWMPLAPDNLRILPDVGPVRYTSTPAGELIVWFGFGNVGDQQYGFALLSSGVLQAFDPTTGAVLATVFSADTVFAPSSIFGASQWGSQFMLFCKDQTNGYWVWDGKHLFTAGTIDPLPDITNAGSKYSSPPLVNFQTTSGTAVLPIAQTTILNESVVKIEITSPGSGFGTNDFLIGTFSGGGSDDQAEADATIGTGGGVKEVVITNPGSGYTSYAKVVFSGGGTPLAGAVGYPVIQDGAITAITMVTTGAEYTSPPTVTIDDPGFGSGSTHVSGGSGFIGTAIFAQGQVIALNVVEGGTGYTTPPTVTIVGDGTGLSATAEISGGQVIGFVIKQYGEGYTKALVLLTGGNNAANATFAVFPFDISGTAIETNQNRVWIANGSATAAFPPKGRVIFSDPETPTGFGNGGGAFKSNDSFLRVGYHWLKQTNGFLYLGGDSSTNYISGVSTSTPSTGGSPITTFSNQNVDPQIGSPWPASVQVFSRNIVLANPQGIYVSYGGAMTKISTPIDPLYATCPTLFSPSSNFSSAVAEIFNIPVYMLLLPVTDVRTGASVNKLLMWDGKRWFTSQQSKPLTFIATQEYNSVLTAWGTDGTTIFPLFQTPSAAFTKSVISKFFSFGYFITKIMSRLQGVVQSYDSGQSLDISIDSDANPSAGPYSVLVGAKGTWYGAGGVVGTWTGLGGAVGTWMVGGIGGLQIFGPEPVGQWGRMLGYTITTTATDMALVSILGEAQDYAPNV